MHSYVIGIDLGTTNCTLSYAASQAGHAASYMTVPHIELLSIPQTIASGRIEGSFSLPSFLYFPLKEELSGNVVNVDGDLCVGTFARDRGAELPGRVIASAKSWLCHAGIDRRSSLLPLGADESLSKISPLKACAALLRHMLNAWNQQMPDAPFDKQQILITVPASFDPSARQLVQEAAILADYPAIILLEEPQAAFYAWLHQHAEEWRKQLTVGDQVLVVDIGGGTTDFSLISVIEEEGQLALERVAVGSHLLLGGDNIDLSLAYLAKERLEEKGHAIDEWQMQSLVHVCRQAKEKLLSDEAPEKADITIQGRGSRLIGGSLSTSITLKEVQELIVDGFFPLVEPQERSHSERRSGIQQMGLPYAQDARVTCQLAKFLAMMGEAESSSMDRFVMPTAILFNGGTLKAAALRKRLVDLLNKWAKALGKPPLKVLPAADYDYAVSRGAVYYALARQGKGVRIKAGTSCSYYIGVEDAAPAVPGIQTPLKAVCMVPFGMEEGSEASLNQTFSLLLGEPATFRFFSHHAPTLSSGVEPVVGTVVKQWKQELTELHPIETLLEKSETDGKVVSVTLKSHLTELGVLELWCVADDGRRWKLEFNVREKETGVRN